MNMMRYQRLSPEYLPLPNGRKPPTHPSLRTSITSCKEDNHNSAISTITAAATATPSDNSRHHDAPNGITAIKPSTRVRSTASPDRHFPTTPELICTKPIINHNNLHDTTAVLQWGQNKRSRGSRAENRSSGDDSSSGKRRRYQHPSKIQHRSISVIDKQSTTPVHNNNNNKNSASLRNGHLRSSTVTTSSSPSAVHRLSRKMEERSSIGQQQHHRLEKRHHHQQQHHHLPTPAEKLLKSSSTTTPHQYHHPFSGKADCTPPPEKDVVTPVITTVETKSVGVIGGGGGGEKINLDLLEWPRIFLSLSRKEKEDDFFAMKGTKLPHRPKKRPKNIDKTLQYCSPGMWLSDLTRGRYEVREKKCVKKKRRGLKGMESMDSDSD
ncbi:hypothetical protein ZOSMA_105G00180 [Zostera marina]|uniref:DUF1639 family protein n=1 Tax=Zostera marina TaxID=29655 RepID=A0A0K9Q4J7_ZOSMR|nr:hypothetical protein ZOSMA_105G00180 [Zostera marina]